MPILFFQYSQNMHSRLLRNLLLLTAAVASSRLGHLRANDPVCTYAGEGVFPGSCPTYCISWSCTCDGGGTGSYTLCNDCNGDPTGDYAGGCVAEEE